MSIGLTLWNEYQIANRQNHRLKHYESKLKRRLNGWAANKTLTVFEFMFYTSLLISAVALVYYIGISIGGISTTGSEQEAFIKQGLILINMAAILPVLARKLHVAGAQYYADAAQEEYENEAQVDVENLKAKDDLVHDLDGRLEQLESENALLIEENQKAEKEVEETLGRFQELMDKYSKREQEYEDKLIELREKSITCENEVIVLRNNFLQERENYQNEIRQLEAIIKKEKRIKNEREISPELVGRATTDISSGQIKPAGISAPHSAFHQPMGMKPAPGASASKINPSILIPHGGKH